MLSIESVNKMDYSAFTETFGSVIEHSPFVAASVWKYRPFSNRKSLHTAIVTFISQLNEEAKIGLLRCHPDLAGKLAEAGQLSAESTKEQTSAGLLTLTEVERKTLTELNERYKRKFQFPFVVCARENKKDTILREIRKRLDNEVSFEVEHGIEEVYKIAWYRIVDLVDETSTQGNL